MSSDSKPQPKTTERSAGYTGLPPRPGTRQGDCVEPETESVAGEEDPDAALDQVASRHAERIGRAEKKGQDDKAS